MQAMLKYCNHLIGLAISGKLVYFEILFLDGTVHADTLLIASPCLFVVHFWVVAIRSRRTVASLVG